MRNFYNTTLESGQMLMDFETKAQTQEAAILSLFRSLNKPMTWCEVQIMVGFPEISVKRSLTNLKTAGHLEKTAVKSIGVYGRPAYRYQLINPNK